MAVIVSLLTSAKLMTFIPCVKKNIVFLKIFSLRLVRNCWRMVFKVVPDSRGLSSSKREMSYFCERSEAILSRMPAVFHRRPIPS